MLSFVASIVLDEYVSEMVKRFESQVLHRESVSVKIRLPIVAGMKWQFMEGGMDEPGNNIVSTGRQLPVRVALTFLSINL